MLNSNILQNFTNPNVEDKFLSYNEPYRSKLLYLRHLILDTASQIPAVGEIEEALKWGQPSFLTSKSKSGSTIRVDQIKTREGKYAMYFICTTNLVDRFQDQYPRKMKYEDSRSIIFGLNDEIPEKELKNCISQALTYHLDKKQ